MKNNLSMLVLLVLPILLGFGSCSSGPRFLERIPGGVLDGEVVGSVVEDWSFVADAGLCDLETRPNFPHSIKLNCFNDGPKLYIGCMNCDGKLWSSYVASDPSGRIRIKTKIYPVNLRLLDPGPEMLGGTVDSQKSDRENRCSISRTVTGCIISPQAQPYRLTKVADCL